jgi:hypothetical protein
VSNIELATAIFVFLALGFWVGLLLGGGADANDLEDEVRATRRGSSGSNGRARTALPTTPKAADKPYSPQPVSEAAKPSVAEAIVKLDLPPPTPIPAPTAKPAQISTAAAAPATAPAPLLAPDAVPLPLRAASFSRPHPAPDVNATLPPAPAAAPAAAIETAAPSPHAVRADNLPPSDATPTNATLPPATPRSPAPVATASAARASVTPETPHSPTTTSRDSAAPASRLISTSNRPRRVIGGTSDDALGGLDRFYDETMPRPRTPSIWSTSAPKRSFPADDLEEIEVVIGMPSIKAERLPIRAEPKLVARAAEKPASAAASPMASPGSVKHAADAPSSERVRPEIRFTLPPGALDES